MSSRWLLNRPYMASSRRWFHSDALSLLPFFFYRSGYIRIRGCWPTEGKGRILNFRRVLNFQLLRFELISYYSGSIVYSLNEDTVDGTRQLDKHFLILRYAKSSLRPFEGSSNRVSRQASRRCLHPFVRRYKSRSMRVIHRLTACVRVRIVKGSIPTHRERCTGTSLYAEFPRKRGHVCGMMENNERVFVMLALVTHYINP